MQSNITSKLENLIMAHIGMQALRNLMPVG